MIRINVRENVIGVRSRTAVLTPARTSQLVNDSDFQTGAQVAAAVTEEAYERDMADQNQSIRITALDAKLDKAFIKRTASGAVASFDDGGDDLPVKALTVNIDPVQSGSGDPYPAGGGTNILPPFAPGTYSDARIPGVTAVVGTDQLITVTGTLSDTDSDVGIWIPLSKPIAAGGEYMHYRNSMAVSGVEAYFDNGSGWSDLAVQNAVETAYEGDITGLSLVFHPPVEGSVTYNFTMQVSVEATGAATDWTPYENIRPISGWTGATVTRTGKNLLDLSNVKLGSWNKWNIPNTLKPNTTYTYSVSNATYAYGLFMTYNHTETGNGTSIRLVGYIKNNSVTFTTPANVGDYPWLILGGTSGNAGHADADFQLELGSTATDYELYQGETYSITFPAGAGTVYGGTLDVTNGVLTVDLAVHEFTPDDVVSTITDLSDATISPLTRVDYFKSQNPSFPLAAAIATEPQTRGKYSHGTYVGDNGGYTSRTYHGYAAADAYHIFIPCAAAGDTVAEYLYDQQENGTPVQLCFPLAEPLTYQLTPREVRTLLGSNAIYADTGDTTVTYRADPTLVIGKLASALQT
ncbi:MAG: hypothetical protein IJU18_00140 [Oscillospiraceae bacterium]|nr:hypothetical protein [Oscillospiraceae bacterium]